MNNHSGLIPLQCLPFSRVFGISQARDEKERGCIYLFIPWDVLIPGDVFIPWDVFIPGDVLIPWDVFILLAHDVGALEHFRSCARLGGSAPSRTAQRRVTVGPRLTGAWLESQESLQGIQVG